MNRHEFFIKRLRELGLYDEDSDYEGMIGTAVEELSEIFAKQGHSGFSAMVTLGVFNQLIDEYNNYDFSKDIGIIEEIDGSIPD